MAASRRQSLGGLACRIPSGPSHDRVARLVMRRALTDKLVSSCPSEGKPLTIQIGSQSITFKPESNPMILNYRLATGRDSQALSGALSAEHQSLRRLLQPGRCPVHANCDARIFHAAAGLRCRTRLLPTRPHLRHMKLPRSLATASIVLIAGLTCTVAGCGGAGPEPPDTINLGASNGSNAAVLLDGRRTSCVDDELRSGSGSLSVDNVMTPGTCSSEMAVFAEGHSMQLLAPLSSWTDNGGTLSMSR